jgi:hypothetical protein
MEVLLHVSFLKKSEMFFRPIFCTGVLCVCVCVFLRTINVPVNTNVKNKHENMIVSLH